jgi:HK97 family phage major capsid protein
MDDTQDAYVALQVKLRQARREQRIQTGHLDAVDSALTIASRDHQYAKMAATVMAMGESRAKVTEPLTYHYGSEQSFFYDAVRDRLGRGDAKSARARLDRHRAEMDVELPKRAEARARAAHIAYEAAFAADAAGQETLSRMQAAGINPFERRAMSRTDTQGGFLSPPIYLVDQFVQYAREASPFATRFTQMDLPQKTSEINVPRMAVGAAMGPQSDTAPAPTRDITDSLVSAPVKTIAGIADASLQWLEQGQGSGGYGVDQVIWADLTADLATNVDGQALLGSGSGGQLLGVWPAGAIAAANGIIVADTTADVWTAASGTANLQVSTAQLVSLLRRLRGRSDGLTWYWHPWVWSLYTAQVDSQTRPLVTDQDAATFPDGVLGYYMNVPVIGDNNIPTTFGGTVAPSMSTITNGQYAANAGTGSGASYTPMLLARTKDLFLFQGDLKLQIFNQVLAGAGMVRFQAHQYLAAMPNRYVAGSAVGSTVSAGGDVAHATLTSQHSGSLLILSGSGY